MASLSPARLALTLALLALVGGAIVARSTSASYVFGEDHVRLLDADAYYHLRHARFAAAHFPRLQRWDVGARYPTGERALYAGLYDLTVAAAARGVAGGVPSEAMLGSVIAWAPVVLGAAALIVLFGLVRAIAGSVAGLFACVVLTLHPGDFLARTVLGFADHHAAEVMLFLLAASSVVACFGDDRSSRLRQAGRAILRSSPLVAFYFTWPGAPLVVTVLGGAATLAVLAARVRGADLSRSAAALAFMGAVFVAATLALGLLVPDLVMNASLHEAQLAGMLVALCAPLLVTFVARQPLGVRLLVIAGLLGIGAILSPLLDSLAERVPDLLGPKSPFVREQVAPTPLGFLRQFGWPGVVALAAPAVAWFAAFGFEQRWRALVLAAVGCGWIFVWWRTHDYAYSVPPLLAALFGIAVAPLLRRGSRGRSLRLLTLLLMLVAPVALRWHPTPWATLRSIESMAVLDRGWEESLDWLARTTPPPTLPVDADVAPFAENFRYPPGAYGVASAWSFGNFVAALGHRTPVASQGLSRLTAEAFLAADEDTALALWQSGCEPGESVRYVMVDAATVGDHFATMAAFSRKSLFEFVEQSADGVLRFGAAYHRTHVARLYHGAGSGLHHVRLVHQSSSRSLLYYAYRVLPGDAIGEEQVRFRLHSEFVGSAADCASRANRLRNRADDGSAGVAQDVVYDAQCAPSVRTFEIVPSARVAGRAPREALVSVSLALRSDSDGAAIEYRQETRAGSDGRFSLSLPYATRRIAGSAVVAMGPYRVSFTRSLDDPATGSLPDLEFEIEEAQVDRGDTLELEALARTAPGAA